MPFAGSNSRAVTLLKNKPLIVIRTILFKSSDETIPSIMPVLNILKTQNLVYSGHRAVRKATDHVADRPDSTEACKDV